LLRLLLPGVVGERRDHARSAPGDPVRTRCRPGADPVRGRDDGPSAAGPTIV